MMSHTGGGEITSANESIQDLRDAAVSNMAPICPSLFCPCHITLFQFQFQFING